MIADTPHIPPEISWLRGSDERYMALAMEPIIDAARRANAALEPACIGAASGLGKAIALEFAREGANLVLVDIAPAVESLAAEIQRDWKVPARAFTADVTDYAAMQVIATGGLAEVLHLAVSDPNARRLQVRGRAASGPVSRRPPALRRRREIISVATAAANVSSRTDSSSRKRCRAGQLHLE